MIGKVFIKNLLLKVKIGVSEKERNATQDIVVNINITTDISKATKSEDVADTVNYSSIQDSAVLLAAAKKYVLMETFASAVADACLNDPRITKVVVRAEKPHRLAMSESVGVEVEKSKE